MIESYYVKIALIIFGTLLILSNLIDVKGIITKLIFKSKISTNKQGDFLEIVSLWYQLKNKCEQCNLSEASSKLDEVFPLLNEVLENDKAN